MKTFLNLTAAALLTGAGLSGCGIVPLPAVSIPDQNLSLPTSSGFEQYVVYDGSDAFAGTAIPSLLRKVQISGKVTYGGAGTVTQARVFLRSSPPECTPLPASSSQLCDPSGESAQQVGVLTLQNGQATSFVISGPALDAAAKAGHGYFGVQVLRGRTLPGDTVKLSAMKASAKL